MKNVFDVTLWLRQDNEIVQGSTYTIAAYTDVQARNLAIRYEKQFPVEPGDIPPDVSYCTINCIASLDLDIEKLPSSFDKKK